MDKAEPTSPQSRAQTPEPPVEDAAATRDLTSDRAPVSPALLAPLGNPNTTGPRRAVVQRLQRRAGNQAVATAVRSVQRAATALPPDVAAPGRSRVSVDVSSHRLTQLLLMGGWSDRKADEVMEILATHTTEMGRLEAAYRATAGALLWTSLRSRMSPEQLRRAQQYATKGELHPVDKIVGAVKGMGTDKDTLWRVLPQAGGARMAESETYFRDHYRSDFADEIANPLTVGSRSSAILAVLRDELSFGWELDSGAFAKAKALYLHGKLRPEDKVHLAITGAGTDTDALFAALAEFASPDQAERAYQFAYSEDLVEFDGKLVNRLLDECHVGRDREWITTYFAGGKKKLTVEQQIELAIGTVSTDEEAILKALADLPEARKAEVAAKLADTTTTLGRRFNGVLSGLSEDDRARIAALLTPKSPVDAPPGSDAPKGSPGSERVQLSDPAVVRLRQLGGIGRGDVYRILKYATGRDLALFRAHHQGDTPFSRYVADRCTAIEEASLPVIFNPDLNARLIWALTGKLPATKETPAWVKKVPGTISEDETYAMALLDQATDDEKRAIFGNEATMATLRGRLTTSEFTAALTKLRPGDLTPAENVAWTTTLIRRERGWVAELMSNTSDALSEEAIALRAALLRAGRDGAFDERELEELTRLQAGTDAALEGYIAARDNVTAAFETAFGMAVGAVLAPFTAGASMAIAKAVLISALSNLLVKKIAQGDRFDFFGEDGFKAFGVGAATGLSGLAVSAANQGLQAAVVARVEQAGGRLAKLAADKTFATVASVAAEFAENYQSGAVESVVESVLTKDEIWEKELGQRLVDLLKEAHESGVQEGVVSTGVSVASSAGGALIGAIKGTKDGGDGRGRAGAVHADAEGDGRSQTDGDATHAAAEAGAAQVAHGEADGRSSFTFTANSPEVKGDPVALHRLASEHGKWSDLIVELERSGAEGSDVAKKLVDHRDRICKELLEPMGAKPDPKASDHPTSDKDLQFQGKDAGRQLLKAEQKMDALYPGWRDAYALSFMTGKDRLSTYEHAVKDLPPAQRAEVERRITKRFQELAFAKELRNAADPDAARTRLAAHFPDVDPAQVDHFNRLRSDEAIAAERRKLLRDADDAMAAFEKNPSVDNGVRATMLQMEANALDPESFIDSATVKSVMDKKRVAGEPALRAAKELQLALDRLVAAAPGDSPESKFRAAWTQDYKAHKVMSRQLEVLKRAGFKHPTLEFVLARSHLNYLLVRDQAHAGPLAADVNKGARDKGSSVYIKDPEKGIPVATTAEVTQLIERYHEIMAEGTAYLDHQAAVAAASTR